MIIQPGRIQQALHAARRTSRPSTAEAERLCQRRTRTVYQLHKSFRIQRQKKDTPETLAVEAEPGQKCASVDHSGQLERAAASDSTVWSSLLCCDLFPGAGNMVCLVFGLFLLSGDFRCNTLLSLDLWGFACPRYTRVTPRVSCRPVRRYVSHHLSVKVR